MEMKEIAKNKTLWKMNSVSEPLLVTGVEVNPLKKFTIPKIRRTAEKGNIYYLHGRWGYFVTITAFL